VTGLAVHLRPFREADLDLVARFATDPAFSAPYEWSGYKSPDDLRRRFEEDGFLGKDPHQLVVAAPDETALGWVMWRDPNLLGWQGLVWEIGALLAPEHRGRGAGTAAQRLLAELLFDTTTVHRLCANTEADNVAEQRSLEKAGFLREGLLREAGFRGGRWRDVVVYGRLRDTI
jgi:[ribosomal protein S5]-alanine N-acetyltransferase